MAYVLPFRGVRYSPHRIENIKDVTAPPYDVISPEFQLELHARHPANVVHLILPEPTKQLDRYRAAAALFRQWIENGTLVQDAENSFYIYEQEYADQYGDNRRRRGFMGLVKLEEEAIFGHERTFTIKKADRYHLLKACQANLSPIFAFYAEHESRTAELLERLSSGSPTVDVTTCDDARISGLRGSVRNRLWVTSDATDCRALSAALSHSHLFIADGHHRYETALAYRDIARDNSNPNLQPCDFAMMMLVSFDDPGSTILPTHRLIRGIPEFDPSRIFDSLQSRFRTKRKDLPSGDLKNAAESIVSQLRAEDAANNRAIGVFSGGSELLLVYIPNQTQNGALADLDVSFLHTEIVKSVLNVNEDRAAEEGSIQFVRDEVELLRSVREGQAQLAFFLNAPRLSEVRNVALTRTKMPHKSTYFYPKLLTGLVFYKHF